MYSKYFFIVILRCHHFHSELDCFQYLYNELLSIQSHYTPGQ